MKATKVSKYEGPTANQNYMRKLAKALLLFPIIVFLLNGCTEPLEEGLPGSESDPSYYHSTGWKDDPQHGSDFCTNSQNCEACHGEDMEGGSSGVSCVACHAENLHHRGTVSLCCYECHHENDIANCEGCHPDCKPGSHPTHITVNNKGPATALDCDGCHDIHNYPLFGEADAAESLADTNVCDDCHSKGGAYDGLDDPTIGAKNNWASGVYSGDGSTLNSGKEKWCVGCHDNDPAIIDGVYAPKVGGDSVNYGYFMNGHGNAPNDTELACTDCHDVANVAFSHIDGDERTYAFSSGIYNDGSSYQAGYRLKSVDGQPPLKIPANTRTDDDYRLCFDSGCHVWNDIFQEAPTVTNFNASGPDPPLSYSYGIPPTETNQHHLHVVTFVDGLHWSGGLPWWDSDWDLSTSGAAGYFDSTITCVTCHNVHGAQGYFGSTNEAMIRDGNLVNGRPDTREGFKFSYVREDTGAGGLPMVTSSGATRHDSIGAVFRTVPVFQTWTEIYIGNMCMGCHGDSPQCDACHPSGAYNTLETESYNATGTYLEYYRTPY
jgi:hypothetical protein